MNIESFQDSLFEDPIGLRFRHLREKQRLSLESVAQQLKLPLAILDAIEREDWARLGAPIFVRSYVGSYAKFLGLPVSLADDVVRGKPTPRLAAVGTVPPARRMFDRGVMNLAYLAMTVVILGSVVALAMYFQSPQRSGEVLPADATATYAGGALPAGTDTASAEPAPVTASLAPPMAGGGSDAPVDAVTTGGPVTAVPEAAAVRPGAEIVLRFIGDSWVDIVDRNGAHVERGLLAAGSERRYASGQLAEVTLGNASAVEVSSGGAAVDLAPFSEAKVAHFTVSSEGRIGASASD
jgi:cytoskeleton protein RodZ